MEELKEKIESKSDDALQITNALMAMAKNIANCYSRGRFTEKSIQNVKISKAQILQPLEAVLQTATTPDQWFTVLNTLAERSNNEDLRKKVREAFQAGIILKDKTVTDEIVTKWQLVTFSAEVETEEENEEEEEEEEYEEKDKSTSTVREKTPAKEDQQGKAWQDKCMEAIRLRARRETLEKQRKDQQEEQAEQTAPHKGRGNQRERLSSNYEGLHTQGFVDPNSQNSNDPRFRVQNRQATGATATTRGQHDNNENYHYYHSFQDRDYNEGNCEDDLLTAPTTESHPQTNSNYGYLSSMEDETINRQPSRFRYDYPLVKSIDTMNTPRPQGVDHQGTSEEGDRQ
jgi:hypothetical protein